MMPIEKPLEITQHFFHSDQATQLPSTISVACAIAESKLTSGNAFAQNSGSVLGSPVAVSC